MPNAPTWGKNLDLYLDLGVGGENPLVVILDGSDRTGVAPSLVVGEVRPVTLHLGVRDAAGEFSPRALAGNDAISLTGKEKQTPATVLFFLDSFVAGGTAENPTYTGNLSLAGSALNSAVTSAALTCLVDLLIVGVGGERVVAQFEIVARRRAHESTPPVAPEVLPLYLTQAQSDVRYTRATGAAVRVTDAGVEMLFPDTIWRVLTPRIVGGLPTFEFVEV
jgi:hypothetical protein